VPPSAALPYGTHERKLRLAMKLGDDYRLNDRRPTLWAKVAALQDIPCDNAARAERRTGVGKLNDMRRLAETARKLLAKNDVKVKQALEKAADVVDSKTKGKYSEKIEGAVAKAKEAVDKLPDRPPPPEQPDQPEAPDQPDRETGPG
jgi:hypothetical protein